MQNVVFVISADTLGRGDDTLGASLMANFLRKLWGLPEKPATVVFYNSGVRLLAPGSPALDAVSGLALAGVDLLACGTCVNHYRLAESLQAGRISDMQEIVALLAAAGRVVTV